MSSVRIMIYLILLSPASFAQVQECKCDNMDAKSTPSRESDICTKTHTSSTCSLRWNISSPPSSGSWQIPSSDRVFYNGFIEAVGFSKTTVGFKPLTLITARCGSNSDETCVWVEFLREGNYDKDPENTAVGYIGLATGALRTADQNSIAGALVLEVKEPKERIALGLALSGRSEFNRDRTSYRLQAAKGCLRVQIASGLSVVVQNWASRVENTCPK